MSEQLDDVAEVGDFLAGVDWEAYEELVARNDVDPSCVDQGRTSPTGLLEAYRAAGGDLRAMTFDDLALLRHSLLRASGIVDHLYMMRLLGF